MSEAPERSLRSSIWAMPFGRRERLLLSIQAKADRRKIPQLWYWRLLRPEDDGGTAADDVLYESPRIHRKYADPVPIHVYVDWSGKTKGRKKGGTDSELLANIEISRAELRRLGNDLATNDDNEGLVSVPNERHKLFVPRGGDIFRFDDDHFEIVQMRRPERYGPTRIPVVYKGTAHLYRQDSTAPALTLPEPPTPQPPVLTGKSPRFAWLG